MLKKFERRIIDTDSRFLASIYCTYVAKEWRTGIFLAEYTKRASNQNVIYMC